MTERYMFQCVAKTKLKKEKNNNIKYQQFSRKKKKFNNLMKLNFFFLGILFFFWEGMKLEILANWTMNITVTLKVRMRVKYFKMFSSILLKKKKKILLIITKISSILVTFWVYEVHIGGWNCFSPHINKFKIIDYKICKTGVV